MSEHQQEQTQETQPPSGEPTPDYVTREEFEQHRASQQTREPQSSGTTKGKGYHVSDLPEGAVPDPLGDASLSAQERATATSDAK